MTTDIRWLSPTDFVTGDKSLRISYPSVTHPAVEIKTTTPGDLKWIYLGLRVPPDHDIHTIHVCYQLSNSRSFISQVRLVEMQTPDQAVVRHDDATDLLSIIPACYQSPVVAFRPGAAVLLALRLNFGKVADTITLGAIGVGVFSSCTPVPSYMRSTLPAPGMPGCLARVTDSVRGLWMDQGSQWFSLSGEVVNVKEFGAKGDGITDDQSAFAAAIVSLSPSNSSHGGVVEVPPGTYRFASTLSIKKSIVIRGATGTGYLGCVIQPDMGITPFIIERYNTPDLIQSTAGDQTVIERLTIVPAAKTPVWTPNTYVVGDRRKVGNGNGENWAKHYECVIAGSSASSDSAPRGFGTELFANAAVVNNQLYVIGKVAPAPTPNEASVNNIYDPIANSWIARATPPLGGRYAMGSAVFNNNVYLFGGADDKNDAMADVAVYDPATDTWPQTSMPMLTKQAGLAAALVGNVIYVIGGHVGPNMVLNTVKAYDPATDTWDESIKPMPTARTRLAVAVVNGKIYAIGGQDSGGNSLSTVEEYDPQSLTWTPKESMETARAGLAATVINNKIYAIGGYLHNRILATVEEYDPVMDKWTPKASMPIPRGVDSLAVGVIQGILYAVGDEWTVSAYDFSTDSWMLNVPTIVDGTVHWAYIGGGHGIKLRARATIRDVSILSCSGNGVHIEAQDPEIPAAVAIADGWCLDNVNVYGCDGHGYFMNGSDAHGGVAIGGMLNANGQQALNYGIYDASFLGNTFVGCLINGNGNGVFSETIGGGSVFLGCYLEGGFGDGILIHAPSMIIGGGLAGGTYLSSTMAPLVIQSGGGRYCREFIFEVKAPSGPDGLTRIGSSDSTNIFMKRQAGKDVGVSFALEYGFGNFGGCTDVYGWTHGNSAYDRTGVMTAGGHTILNSWPMQVPPGRAIFEEFYIGQSRHKTSTATSDPTAGTWNPGDRIYFIGAACVPGGPEGKVCVTPGTADIFADTVTATTDGTNTVALSAEPAPAGGERGVRSLRVGMIITINGTTRRIIAMADDLLSMTMDGPIAAAGPGLPITYSPPVFKDFGSIAP